MEEISRIVKSKVLAVEGYDERSFFKKLLEDIGIIDEVQIIVIEGKDKFIKKLPILIKQSEFDTVEVFAVIRDADKNADDSFVSVSNIIKGEELMPPEEQGQYSVDKPRVGIFIMPGDSAEGMLEDLCLSTVQDHEAMNCVNSFVDCAEKLSESPKNWSRAKAQIFLAALPKIRNSVGFGALHGCWDMSSPALDDIKKFLELMK